MARIFNLHKKPIDYTQGKITQSKSLNDNKKRVFVGLSGGVDSAVSATLLKEQGFDVTGVFIKVWQPDFLPCNWREERRDAMRVAVALDIPFLFFDFEKEYKKSVADNMINEYKVGRTPNPDVLCNREIKFGAFWKKAKSMGADFVATGHYAQIRKLGSGNYELMEGNDTEKDQSYFLWTLTQSDLAHTIFPVGNLEKIEVRSLARKYRLPVSEKKDSQGLCFIGDISLENFLSNFISIKPGRVLDVLGNKIGTHKGAILYTAGERHGFDITKKNSDDGAFYVVSKDIKKNTLTVSNKYQEIISLSPTSVTIKNVNWITKPKNREVTARIRYRGEKLPVILDNSKEDLVVRFEKPVRGLSVGQSIVFYLSDESRARDVCLGGGVMDQIS